MMLLTMTGKIGEQSVRVELKAHTRAQANKFREEFMRLNPLYKGDEHLRPYHDEDDECGCMKQ